jgi:hypothetical protein
MTSFPEVVVIGAGPYGLSIGAHLRERGIDFRIFGRTMGFWHENMPAGMLLKSDAYASNLSDPRQVLTLKAFYEEKRLPYADEGIPVTRARFVDYGRAFQQRMVPEVDERLVVTLDRTAHGFLVKLDDGELVIARKVIIAVGIGHFAHVPTVFAGLPPDLLTHSSVHRDLETFHGREVCVVGGGASASCIAALLHEAGAAVQLVARELRFHDRLALHGRSLWQRLQEPHSGVGGGWRSVFFANAPLVFRAIPEQTRLRVVRNANGPAGGWAMKERTLGKFPIIENHRPQSAWQQGDRVRMVVAAPDGAKREIEADHIIAATGYNNDLRRLNFLTPALGSQIRAADHTPVLSANLESSVRGLYFAGPIAKNTFGPMMRFVFGARFAARRSVRHIAASASRRLVPGHAPAGAD